MYRIVGINSVDHQPFFVHRSRSLKDRFTLKLLKPSACLKNSSRSAQLIEAYHTLVTKLSLNENSRAPTV